MLGAGRVLWCLVILSEQDVVLSLTRGGRYNGCRRRRLSQWIEDIGSLHISTTQNSMFIKKLQSAPLKSWLLLKHVKCRTELEKISSSRHFSVSNPISAIQYSVIVENSNNHVCMDLILPNINSHIQ